MEPKIMSIVDVRNTIIGSEGKIFRVEFIKRTTGELRVMYARIGVKKELTGVGQSFKPFDKGLITVFDMDKGEYRMINLDTVMNLKVIGQEYEVKEYKKEHPDGVSRKQQGKKVLTRTRKTNNGGRNLRSGGKIRRVYGKMLPSVERPQEARRRRAYSHAKNVGRRI